MKRTRRSPDPTQSITNREISRVCMVVPVLGHLFVEIDVRVDEWYGMDLSAGAGDRGGVGREFGIPESSLFLSKSAPLLTPNFYGGFQ